MGNRLSDSKGLQPKVAAGYAGDVTPQEAWDALSEDKNAVLVDVRTTPEWAFVGVPNLASIGKDTIFIQWREYPSMTVNGNFAKQLLAEIDIARDDAVFFICRSGGRSADAAIEMTRHGFTKCYNIAGGFEGDINENGQRALKNGWKYSNLPWEQR